MTPRSPARNLELREEARRKILEAALALFAERGYQAATMAAVARRAGVSKGLAYHYFASKEELLEEIVVSRIEDSLARSEPAFAGRSAADALRAVVDASLEHARAHPDAARLHLSLALQPEAAAGVMRAKQRLAPRLGRWQGELERILAALGYADARRESFFLSACLNGLVLTWLAAPSMIPLDLLRERLLEPYLGERR